MCTIETGSESVLVNQLGGDGRGITHVIVIACIVTDPFFLVFIVDVM
jgi:hypothetical protein